MENANGRMVLHEMLLLRSIEIPLEITNKANL